MKVKELIEELKFYDQELDVIIEDKNRDIYEQMHINLKLVLGKDKNNDRYDIWIEPKEFVCIDGEYIYQNWELNAL